MTIQLVHTIAALREAVEGRLAHEHEGAGLGLIPTMGALHAGHASLIETARAENRITVVSIFVNPLQFGDPEDLKRYPRTLDADVQLLDGLGVDIVFAPEAAELYPQGEPLVRISSGALGKTFEGVARPGFFDGSMTVIAKLLHLAAPQATVKYRAYFGQKDAQQVALVRRMVRDLNFQVQIVSVPIVREPDGLALSSRNRFLGSAERSAAAVLFRALKLLEQNALNQEPLDLDGAQALVRSEPLADLDYLEVVDLERFAPLAQNCRNTPFTGSALAIVAANFGTVRLVDSMPLEASSDR